MEKSYYKRTRFAVIWTNLINEPFASLQNYIPFILTKSLQASTFWIVVVTMLRPVVSIFSFYWSSRISHLKESLRANLVIAGILARLPFLLFPWIYHPAYIVFSGIVYVLFTRASIPAWMEILKVNLPKEKREKIFSLGWVLGYLEGIFLAIGIGYLLDIATHAWSYLFLASALIGMTSVIIQGFMPIKGELVQKTHPIEFKHLLQPWKDCLSLIRSRKDFAKFQMGFMAGGFGVMLMQPALPIFFNRTLMLSYISFSIAISMCKGLGIVISSPIWTRYIHKRSILHLASIVCVFFALFPVGLLFSSYSLVWLYVAYVVYGIAQGGSHLVWHMSGPIFAEHENSAMYSGVNVIMVGVRGLVAPILGGILCKFVGAMPVFIIGGIACLIGPIVMWEKALQISYKIK